MTTDIDIDEAHVRIPGDYGSCAAIPMLDAERERADAMAREKCDDGSCDMWGLLLARRVLDLLEQRAPSDRRTVAQMNDDHEDNFEPPDSSHGEYLRGLST